MQDGAVTTSVLVARELINSILITHCFNHYLNLEPPIVIPNTQVRNSFFWSFSINNRKLLPNWLRFWPNEKLNHFWSLITSWSLIKQIPLLACTKALTISPCPLAGAKWSWDFLSTSNSWQVQATLLLPMRAAGAAEEVAWWSRGGQAKMTCARGVSPKDASNILLRIKGLLGLGSSRLLHTLQLIAS